jgi:ribonuclease HII
MSRELIKIGEWNFYISSSDEVEPRVSITTPPTTDGMERSRQISSRGGTVSSRRRCVCGVSGAPTTATIRIVPIRTSRSGARDSTARRLFYYLKNSDILPGVMARKILGIDEAGRGAILGPLIMAGVLFEDKDEIFDILAQHNVRDSKLLTREKRYELSLLVRRLKLAHATVRVTPAVIDEESLNTLEIEHSSRLINRLCPDVVYLDVPVAGAGIARYCNAVSGKCETAPEIVGGNYFDSIHLSVAAASIIAKEAREREVRKLHRIYGNFGSGYPHDPYTRAWLRAWREGGRPWPRLVRKKWRTLLAEEFSQIK